MSCPNLKKTMKQLDNLHMAEQNNGVPSCWNCCWSGKYHGTPDTRHEPGEPPVTECMAFDVQYYSCPDKCKWHPIVFAFFEYYYSIDESVGDWETDATPCPLYKAMPVKECAQCKEPMDKTVLTAPHNTFYDTKWFCSEECKEEFEKELDREIREHGAGCF